MAKMIYQYKIADSVKDDAMQVSGINLRREWTPFTSIQTNLIPFIKTLHNPNGILDYSKKNMESNEVIYKSIPNMEDLTIYSKQDLFIMNRQELCEICKAYTIITQNKRNERLIREILESQAKYSTNKQIQDDNIQPSISEILDSLSTVDKELNPDIRIVVDNTKEISTKKTIFDILKKK